jgi:hypothetical protein
VSPILGANVAPPLQSGMFYQWSQGIRKNQGATAAVNLRFYAVRRTFKTDTVVSQLGIRAHTAGSAGAVARLMIYADSSGYPGALVSDLGTVDLTSVGEKMLSWSATIPANTTLWACAIPTGWSTTAPQFVWLYATETGEPDLAPYTTAAALVAKTPANCFFGTAVDGTAPANAPAGMTPAGDTPGPNLDVILKIA